MKPNIYWNNLSFVDKEKIINEYEYWDGFKTYKYFYLPNDLKQIIVDILRENGV